MEEKNEIERRRKRQKKRKKAHQDIYLVLLFVSESGSLWFALYHFFKENRVCYMPICRSGLLEPNWHDPALVLLYRSHSISFPLSFSRSLALIFHFVSAFFSTGQARQNEANSSQLSIKKSCHFVYYLLVSFSFTRFENRLKYNQQYIMCVMQTIFLIPFLPKYFIKFVPVEAIQQIGYNL